MNVRAHTAILPLLLLSLLPVAPSIVAAQSTGVITGTVTRATDGKAIVGAVVRVDGTTHGSASTAPAGTFIISAVNVGRYTLEVESIGYRKRSVSVKVIAGDTVRVDVALAATVERGRESVVRGGRSDAAEGSVSVNPLDPAAPSGASYKSNAMMAPLTAYQPQTVHGDVVTPDSTAISSEQYNPITENPFLVASTAPLSTFSIDVDAASYSNVRRFITDGTLPPTNAVRIEELVNYFDYAYPQPTGMDPFSITTDAAVCPWNPEHRLVLIGLQGRAAPAQDLPASNLVFLIDVSGSMSGPKKLGLVKKALRLLVNNLGERDRVSIVVYAGAAGLVLPSTPGSDREVIRAAIDQLQAGGSTAGGAGIQLAYETARRNFIDGGNNRVILCTDGDFNVGVSSQDDLVKLIEEKRKSGVFLSVLGFGGGNLQDGKMEQLADKGNGQYAYIDGEHEAEKVFVHELGATLLTIAKDVKIQVEFNPAEVRAYRLIGYENRMLATEDFDDDTKDAGELGAGHAVTVLYEIIPAFGDAGPNTEVPDLSDATEQNIFRPASFRPSQLLEVKLRYKEPDAERSRLVYGPAIASDRAVSGASENLRFAAAVAAWGMVLRDSRYSNHVGYDTILDLARSAIGGDRYGYRKEFIDLVEKSRGLAR